MLHKETLELIKQWEEQEETIEEQTRFNNDGGIDPPDLPKVSDGVRPTYPQDWPSYDAAKTNEDVFFKRLLLELLQLAVDEPVPDKRGGRPGFSRKDKIFCMAIKTYYKSDLRKATGILKELHNLHLIGGVPCYKSIDNFFNDESLSKILDRLILLTALPLATVELTGAIDSTGYSISKYEAWSKHKWGRKDEREESRRRCWRKLHAVVGCKTNIFLSAEVTDKNVSDIAMLATAVSDKPKYFNMQDFVADKAYSSREVFRFLDKLGFTPYIPFKKRTRPDSRGAPAWRQMYEHFLKSPEEFMNHYHQRSNVETCFHMLKSRYGTHLYTKRFTANANEIKTRVLCHNLCVLLQEAVERGISLQFEDCVKTLSTCVETP